VSLTTHVLDTARGQPAAGVAVEVAVLGRDGARRVLHRTATNAEGRTDGPLLVDQAFVAGEYEIVFGVGDYFAPEPAFYETVVVRFVVRDARAHHHVPLLVSPWGYSTYRGS
jgi:5-hydroxyisourate hydrolase